LILIPEKMPTEDGRVLPKEKKYGREQGELIRIRPPFTGN